MSAASTSSSVSMADTVRDTCSRVSAKWRRFACSVTLGGVGHVSCHRSPPIGCAVRRWSPAAAPARRGSCARATRAPVPPRACAATRALPQLVHRRLELRHLVRRLGHRLLHRRVPLDDRGLELDPQGVDRLAGLRTIDLALGGPALPLGGQERRTRLELDRAAGRPARADSPPRYRCRPRSPPVPLTPSCPAHHRSPAAPMLRPAPAPSQSSPPWSPAPGGGADAPIQVARPAKIGVASR